MTKILVTSQTKINRCCFEVFTPDLCFIDRSRRNTLCTTNLRRSESSVTVKSNLPKRLPRILFLLAILFFSNKAEACKCLANPDVSSALNSSAAVFSGIVREVEHRSYSVSNHIGLPQSIDASADIMKFQAITFELDKTYKGVAPGKKTLVVSTQNEAAACGYQFEVGKSYLVYTFKMHAPDKNLPELVTSYCTRTKAIDENTAAEISELETLSKSISAGNATKNAGVKTNRRLRGKR